MIEERRTQASSWFVVSAVITLLLLSVDAEPTTQRTIFNVTIATQLNGPPSYSIAAVPNVAAVANAAVQGYDNFTVGLLTVVSNATGDVLWSRTIAASGSGAILASLQGCSAFAFFAADGVLTLADASTGDVTWRNTFGTTTLAQAFAVNEATDRLALVDATGRMVLVDGATCATSWTTTIADVPAWAEYTGSLAISMSVKYVVAVFSGVLYTLPLVAPHVPLYASNISASYQGTLSGRYAIAHDTLVFCDQSTVSTLDLRNGKHQCIAALNTTQLSYSEVVIGPEGSTIYIVIMDESFASANCGRRCRQQARERGGNNYPMYVTANDVHTGANLWSWFTDDTVSDLTITPSVVAAVSSGGPFALSRKNGAMVSSVGNGLDYAEIAPPLVYGNVWYFAMEYVSMNSASVNFVAMQDDALIGTGAPPM